MNKEYFLRSDNEIVRNSVWMKMKFRFSVTLSNALETFGVIYKEFEYMMFKIYSPIS